MKSCALVLLLLLVSAPAFGALKLGARARYQLIIDREPFGPMAGTLATEEAQPPAQDPQKVLEESNKIQLCAMTITPDGRTAVGLIDNAANPPALITLFDGETFNGLEMLLSDLDEEFATFRREGITFTLRLGLGLVETITPELLAQRKAEAEAAEVEAEARERKRPNSLAEQLIAMQMSLPPDVEAPPLPIPIGDAEMFTRAFNPDKPEQDPETEAEAVVKAGVAELKDAVAAGETPQEYLARLVEHRQKEVRRQQEEKRAAKEALDAELAAGSLSKADEEYIRRRTNIELMKKGVVPLTPVNDLSDEEQAEINAALDAGLEQ